MIINAFKFKFQRYTDKYLEIYGEKIKAMIFSNPSNFMGKVHDHKQVELLFRWCAMNNIHFIIDESSANLQHSAMDYCSKYAEFNKYFHFVYDFSKVFGLSSEIAYYYTENDQIRNIIEQYLDCIPMSENDDIIAMNHIISDTEWMSTYFEENKKQSDQVLEHLVSCLDEHGLEYSKPEHGVNLVLNFSAYLKKYAQDITLLGLNEHKGLNEMELLFKLEKTLYFIFLNEYNLSLIPGQCVGLQNAGYFGLSFGGLNDKKMIETVVNRIDSVINNLNLFEYFQRISIFRDLNIF